MQILFVGPRFAFNTEMLLSITDLGYPIEFRDIDLLSQALFFIGAYADDCCFGLRNAYVRLQPLLWDLRQLDAAFGLALVFFFFFKNVSSLSGLSR